MTIRAPSITELFWTSTTPTKAGKYRYRVDMGGYFVETKVNLVRGMHGGKRRLVVCWPDGGKSYPEQHIGDWFGPMPEL